MEGPFKTLHAILNTVYHVYIYEGQVQNLAMLSPTTSSSCPPQYSELNPPFALTHTSFSL